jgi:RimJ/RimL family protein N-acetyltransferase
MSLLVRPMALEEVDLIVDYFHGATPEHLEQLGVDPTRLPPRRRWRERFAGEYAKPVPERAALAVVWERDGRPIGFSTADRIVPGEHAYLHLHVVDPADRAGGAGAVCVRDSVRIYAESLQLRRVFSEPNAFNVAPNRTLQRAGFRYVKTHWTVPGPLNYHQPVTRWVYELPAGGTAR